MGIEVPDTIDGTPGKLVYCTPTWEDVHDVLDVYPGKVVDRKALLFHVAGKIRAYTVLCESGVRAFRSDNCLSKEWFDSPSVAIQSHIDRIKDRLRDEVNHIEEVERLLNELVAEGKV